MTEAMQIRSAARGKGVAKDDDEKDDANFTATESKERMEKREEVERKFSIKNCKPEVKFTPETEENNSDVKRKEEKLGKRSIDGARRKSGECESRRKSGEESDMRRKSGEVGAVFQKISNEGMRRGSIGRPQIKIPYLAQIERRISMDLLDYSGKLEGLKLLREFNRETSHYRNLVVSLGGSSDCEQLRDDMKRSRQRAADLIRQAKAKILPCLQDPNRFSSSDRKEARRLCKLLFYCIRFLEQDLLRSLTLQNTFTLQLGNQSLINTGVNEAQIGHKSCPLVYGTDQALKEQLATEKSEILLLQKEATELRGYLHKSDISPSTKSWTMEEFGGDRQFLATILEDSDPSSVSSPATPAQTQESNNSDEESLVESFREKLHQRRCLCWIFGTLLTTLLLASLLGTLISFLAS